MIRMNFPSIVGLLVSNVCNLQCHHCCYCATPQNKSEIEFKVITKYIGEWVNKGLVCIDISGGEPFLRSDLIDVVSFCKDLGLQTSIATNGTLVTSTIAKSLAQIDVTSVRVSIDGDCEQHDWLRGKGNYDKAIRGIKLLVSAGVHTSIITTVHQKNWQKIDSVISLAQRLNVDKVKFIPLLPLGRGLALKQLIPNADIWQKVMERVDTFPDDQTTKVTADSPLDCILDAPSQDSIQRACVAGISFLGIKPDGEVFPCPIWDISLGNVNLTPLEKIWQTSPILNKICNPKFLSITCRKCTYRNKCNGGCRAMSYLKKGDITWPDPLCWIANQSDVKNTTMPIF